MGAIIQGSTDGVTWKDLYNVTKPVARYPAAATITFSALRSAACASFSRFRVLHPGSVVRVHWENTELGPVEVTEWVSALALTSLDFVGALDLGFGLPGSSEIETEISVSAPLNATGGNVTSNVTRNVTVVREVVTFVPNGNVTNASCLVAQPPLQLQVRPTLPLYDECTTGHWGLLRA